MRSMLEVGSEQLLHLNNYHLSTKETARQAPRRFFH